jgi:hypothetical protein
MDCTRATSDEQGLQPRIKSSYAFVLPEFSMAFSAA